MAELANGSDVTGLIYDGQVPAPGQGRWFLTVPQLVEDGKGV